MINDERETKDKEKITIKFLLSNNNYNYIINDEREKKDKEKIAIKFLRTNNNNYNYIVKINKLSIMKLIIFK